VKPRDKRANAPRPVRSCQHCETTFSLERRRDAVYCSPRCRVTAWKRRHRATSSSPHRTPLTDHSGPSAA
jgi:hypothetical protein